jgi:cytochrome c oxidase subunit 3
VSEANVAVGGHVGVMEEAPFSIPSSRLVMWLFIISDAVTFGALLFAYGYVRNASANWPAVFEAASIWNALLMTFILVSSSLTVLFAVKAAQSGDRAGTFRWTLITAVGGALFALLHLREWMNLIGAGLRPFSNPWGSPLFGASFFCVTGLHMTHVIAGVIALLVIGTGYKAGRFAPKHVENLSLYWHFVDLVWMFVVPLIYLLNMKR